MSVGDIVGFYALSVASAFAIGACVGIFICKGWSGDDSLKWRLRYHLRLVKVVG